MAGVKTGDSIDQEFYALLAAKAPGLLQEGSSKTTAVAKADKQLADEAQFKDTPGAGVFARLGEGIKISPSAKAEFMASVIGNGDTKEERIADGMKRVRQTESGDLVYIDASGKERMVNQPTTTGQKVLAAGTVLAGPFAPLVAPLAERFYPGTLRETAGDVAGQVGNAMEITPALLIELATRGKGSMLRQMGLGFLADMSGAPLRRAVSQLFPGQDIGALETANRGVQNAAMGVAARGVTGLATEHPRLPGSDAPPSYMERRVGKRLLGVDPNDPTVMAGRIGEERVGVNLRPAALSQNLDAINQENILGQSLGTAEATFAANIEATKNTSQFVKRQADALLGTNIPADEIGERLAGRNGKLPLLKKGLTTKRNNAYAKANTVLSDAAGTSPFPTNELSAKRDELIQRGLLNENDRFAKVPATESYATLDKRVQDLTDAAYAGGRSEATVEQKVASELKEAALKDMRSGLGKNADAYDALRASYKKMSDPLRDFDVELVANVLSKGSPTKLAFEEIPAALMNPSVPRRQVEVALALADRSSPGTAKLWRRSAFESVFDKAAPKTTSLEGTRLAREGAKTDEVFMQAGPAAKAINENLERMSLLAGGGKQVTEDLKTAADIFNRIDLASKGQKGSQTYRMLDADKKLRSLANVIFQPLKTGDELTTILFRKRISELLSNKETRDLLVGIEKTQPQDVGSRSFSTALQRLGMFITRDELFDTEGAVK